MSKAISSGIVPEQRPFDVAWRTMDGLNVRYAMGGKSGDPEPET